MKEYYFGSEEKKILEELRVPLGVFQFIDKRIVVKILSAGFCDLFDFDDPGEAYSIMTNDIFSTCHPDDASRIANAAYHFATEEKNFEVVYRVRTKKQSVYKIVHAYGEHVYLPTGERLAYVWYSDEGGYTGDDDLQGKDLRDVFRSALHRESMIQTSYHDDLTGLPNMSYFLELVKTGRSKLIQAGKTPAVLFIDMSGMKIFNRKYGFAEGDRLLKAFANLLVQYFKSSNCSRFGQDHFAVITDAEWLEPTVKALIGDCSELNGGRNLPIRIGICVDDSEDIEPGTICDRAKYAGDTLGTIYTSDYAYFDSAMIADVDKQQYIVDNFDRAMDEEWIKVYYQPIIRAANGRICDEEALSRWIDPAKGFLSPADFIPALEEAGLIYKLDLYVVDHVISKIQRFEAGGLYVVPQSINLSRSDFDSCDIVEEINRRVERAGIGKDKITIEITESVVGRDLEFISEQVERFHSLGFNVWMDDFGSGYSSLDVLQSIRFDLIKFDMKFMKCFGDSEENRIILTELVRMAIGLGVETVCEGVETEEQVEFLREIGCTKLQGFYFSKPQSFEQIIAKHSGRFHTVFEDPDETGYYSEIGRINLYDTSAITREDSVSMKNYFDTLPMAILECTPEDFMVSRCNSTYRAFMERIFGVFMAGMKISFEYAESQGPDGTGFLRSLRQCSIDGQLVMIDETMSDGSTVHAIIKRIAVNPVTGASALAVAVLAVIDKNAQNAAVGYAQIATALSSDYYDLYYVDIETENFVQYSSDDRYNLNRERHDIDFFENSRNDACTWVYEADRDYFIRSLTKENVLRAIDTQGAFTLTYRLLTGDKPEYVTMKAVRMKGDDSHLIIGVNNVDAQMKEKQALEQLEQERTTFSRISALAGDYICIYAVDPETGTYVEYSATPVYDGLGLDKEGADFFETSRQNVLSFIYPEDLEVFLAMFTKENVMAEIERNGVFVLQYRLIIDGEPRYVHVRAAMVQEKNGPQLIVGLNNVDASVRREMEYAHNLSVAQSHANIDALTGVKNRFAFEDAEDQLNTKLALDPQMEFAVVTFDIRGLDMINNTKGYTTGDLYIRKACASICTLFKHSPVYRIGDDHFAVIASGRDYNDLDELLDMLGRTNEENAESGDIIIAYGEARYSGSGKSGEVFSKAYDDMLRNKRRSVRYGGLSKPDGADGPEAEKAEERVRVYEDAGTHAEAATADPGSASVSVPGSAADPCRNQHQHKEQAVEMGTAAVSDDELVRIRSQLRAIAGSYLSVYEIDITDNSYVEILSGDAAANDIAGARVGNARAMMFRIMDNITDPSGIEEVRRFVDIDMLGERLRHADSDAIEFLNSRGEWCRGKFTVSGRLPDGAVSHAIWTVEIIEKNNNHIYSHIANALAADYNDVYLVDVENGNFAEFVPNHSQEGLVMEKSGSDFFEVSRRDALEMLHPDDQEVFMRTFTRENVMSEIAENGNFTLTYRLMDSGEPVYASMKITRMEGDDSQIIIGINNVDAQMKRQEELETIRSEQITYSRVTALAGDFLCIYTVDPETGRYIEYSGSEMYDHLGLSKEGDDFFGRIRSEAGGTIYIEDIDAVVSMITRDNMLRIINDKGVFVHDYRLMIQGVPTYVRLKAALVEEKDGDKIIVAVINIDDQVRREQEYTCNLAEARNKANIDALTGVKNKHAYIDIESELNYQIEENLPVKFALSVFDINELKKVNDTEGHQAGDEYIRRACRIICNVFKHSPVFRIGGDEFVVIAQGQDYENIHSLITVLEESNARNAGSGDVVIACGVAVYEGDRSVAAVFERADMQMYVNKHNLKSEPATAEAKNGQAENEQ